jgi:hypothetical protein
MEHATSGETPGTLQGSALEPDDRVQGTAELAVLFGRVFRDTKTLTDTERPALRRVQSELLNRLKKFLRISGRLVFNTYPFAFRWKGHTVYEDRDPEALPHMLHRTGIEELHFYPGISEWELERFFEILADSRHGRVGIHALVAGLQDDENLPHVDCVASDNYLEVHPLPIPHDLADMRRRYPHRPMPAMIQEKISREWFPGSEADVRDRRSDDHAFRARVLRILNRLYHVAPEETERISSQIVRESTSAWGLSTVEILGQVLLMERSPRAFDQTVSFMLEFLGHATKTGDFRRAAGVLKELYGCLRVESTNEWQRKALRKAIFGAGTEGSVKAIAEGLRRTGRDGLGDLAAYVSLLQKNAVPHLCRLLAELDRSKTRRIMCDALAALGSNSIEVLGAFLDDNRWYVVRNIVYVLGQTRKAKCVPYLEKALGHADSRVRREAVQAISMTASRDEALEYLKGKLDDQDRRTRGLAALRLARLGGEAAVGPLMEVLASRAFQKREVREIRLFLEAIGLTGSNQAVSALSRIVLKKSVFGKARNDAIRRSAAEALGAIGTTEALLALREAIKVGDEIAREVSLSVLEKVGQERS